MRDDRKQVLDKIEQIAREAACGLGLEVVEVVFHSQGRHSQLRIDIDRAGMPGVGIADCEHLSRALDDRLGTADSLDTTYELQVSSPGIDRPIRSDDDIRRNTGRFVKVAFTDEAGRLREVTGTLDGRDGAMAVRISDFRGGVSILRASIVLMKQDIPSGGRKRNEQRRSHGI